MLISNFALFSSVLHSCFLDTPLYYISFYGPISLVILINTIIFVRSIISFVAHSRRRKKLTSKRQKFHEGLLRQLKMTVGLSVLLGLTWLFGLLMIESKQSWMQYVFVVLTTSQGVFIFLFQCVLRKSVRTCWKATVFQRSFSDTPSSLFGSQTARGALRTTSFLRLSTGPRSRSSSSTIGESHSSSTKTCPAVFSPSMPPTPDEELPPKPLQETPPDDPKSPAEAARRKAISQELWDFSLQRFLLFWKGLPQNSHHCLG